MGPPSVSRFQPVRRRSGDRGFTLIEILLALALIVLFMGLSVVSFESLLRQGPAEKLEDTYWKATREARSDALMNRRPEMLAFDPKHQSFIITSGQTSQTFPVGLKTPAGAKKPELAVTFTQALPSDSYTLVQGKLVDTREIDYVTYYPDGTCTPHTVKFSVDNKVKTIQIDPWTGAEMLPANPSDAGNG